MDRLKQQRMLADSLAEKRSQRLEALRRKQEVEIKVSLMLIFNLFDTDVMNCMVDWVSCNVM